MKLSIIIPTYNEEKRIGKTLEKYYEFYKNTYAKDFEIIVVINNTTDKTKEIVEQVTKKAKEIRWLEFAEPIGKGGAIIEGFKIASGNLIGFVDADMSTFPEDFYNLITRVKGHDGIIGSRWSRGSKVNVKQPFVRRFFSRGFNLCVRALFGLSFDDTQCGSKVFKKGAVKKVLPKLGISSWAFDIDLLYQMKIHHFTISEIPTVWYDKEGSHLNLKRVVPQMFLAVMRLRLIYSKFKFIVKIYDGIHDTFFKKGK